MIPPDAEETIRQQAEEIAALRAEILKQNDDTDAILAIRLSGTVTALRAILRLPDLPPSQDLAEVTTRTNDAIRAARDALGARH